MKTEEQKKKYETQNIECEVNDIHRDTDRKENGISHDLQWQRFWHNNQLVIIYNQTANGRWYRKNREKQRQNEFPKVEMKHVYFLIVIWKINAQHASSFSIHVLRDSPLHNPINNWFCSVPIGLFMELIASEPVNQNLHFFIVSISHRLWNV